MGHLEGLTRLSREKLRMGGAPRSFRMETLVLGWRELQGKVHIDDEGSQNTYTSTREGDSQLSPWPGPEGMKPDISASQGSTFLPPDLILFFSQIFLHHYRGQFCGAGILPGAWPPLRKVPISHPSDRGLGFTLLDQGYLP